MYLVGTAKTLLPTLMCVTTGFLGRDRANEMKCLQQGPSRIRPTFFQLRCAMGPTSNPPLTSLSSRPPAKVGQALADILTPSLIVKEGALAYNLARVHDAIKGNGTPAAVRPHGKAHKCVALAHRQIESGCVGVCAAKIGEAEMFLDGGIKDVLLTNQIVGQKSADRYAQLVARHRDAKVAVCVDSEEGVRELSVAASKFDVALNVLVEVNVGQDRGGVEAEGALDLALSTLRAAPSVEGGAGLLLAGVQGYMGLNQHVRTRQARDEASAKVAEILRRMVSNLEANGVRVPSVTGAGTGTFQGEALQGVLTEVQPGSYIFMDCDYARNEDLAGEKLFRHSLFVLTSVQTISDRGWAVCDAGTKAVSLDSGPPQFEGRTHLRYECAGDEHGKIVSDQELSLKRGDRVMLVPGHCDPTVNLYDWMVFVGDDGVVTAVEPISARGPGV